jgi:LysM repeat protein
LYLIGKRHGISVNQLMSLNNLQSTEIWVNQILLVPAAATPPNPAPPASPGSDSAGWTIPQGTVLVHVKSGQTIWSLAKEYNTTTEAIKTTNHLHVDWVGVNQPLFIPVNSTQAVSVTAPKIAAKPGYGERLDWEYIYWIFDIGNCAVIQDLATGKRFSVKRMGGSNHADCEPLTSADTQIMKDIFGSWGWKYRPVLVEVDGRVLAGSMAGMPHDIDTIANNNFNGHFDLHFLNSRQHNTNAVNPEHQANVDKAAGY